MEWKKIMLALASPDHVAPEMLEKAQRLALALNAELELFSCVYDSNLDLGDRFASGGVTRDIGTIVGRRQRQLERLAARLRENGVTVRTSVRWDHPAYEGIVRHALQQRPDLVIAHSKRRSRAARAVFTRSDYKLIENCPCPVLLVKSRRRHSRCIVAAVDPLCAHGKPASLDDAVLDAAALISQALGGELCIYHACPPWGEIAQDNPDLRQLSEAEEADVRSAYERSFEKRVRTLAERHRLPGACVRVSAGDVAELLPAFANSERADLVVMGVVSRSFVKRIFIGHTSERLLDRLYCDVLVVKSPEFRTQVSDRSTHRQPGITGAGAHSIW